MIEAIATPEPLDTDAGPPGSAVAVVLVAVGGIAGTSLRYLLSETIPPAGDIPVGVLLVNLTGAALLGFLVQVLAMRGGDVGRRRGARLALGAGLLGGFTTYSALATDTAELIVEGRPHVGISYALATIVLGAGATWTGILLGRRIGNPR